jgi:hypothetical protein
VNNIVIKICLSILNCSNCTRNKKIIFFKVETRSVSRTAQGDMLTVKKSFGKILHYSRIGVPCVQKKNVKKYNAIK